MPMLELDHLTILAPSLAEGVDHVRACLDLDIPHGGAHREMGTHNHLLRLSDDTFLEVIAIDPAATPPAHPRWFGLDDANAVRSAWEDGRRLRGWVARTRDLDAVLARHGGVLGQQMRVSRGDRTWLFAVRPDGSLPADGVAPSVMDWGDRGSPARAMHDLGARLTAFAIEHPDLAWVSDLYRQLDVESAPQVSKGAEFRYRATIETPRGLKKLW
jgi:glyoxalase-like protein